ncbi:MAG: hypothetical protein QOF35_388 [Actinomycetota bacterium]|jgi:hypothetical protein|nr:hypothetical protein [Actinomycetota bacterium]
MSHLPARSRRTGRSVILAVALGLAMSALPTAAWAGNGNGHAYGKPCDGCVGKADDKAPPGQDLNGFDPNAGYECDTNHGVGQGNPAHTGCPLTP